MKKLLKNNWLLLAGVIALISAVAVMADESKYTSGTTECALTFGANKYGRTPLLAIRATSDSTGSTVAVYYRTGDRFAPTATPTNGQLTIYVDNSSYALTNNDDVVYQFLDGDTLKTTVASATTTNVTLSTGLTEAGASGDYLYEITQQDYFAVGNASVDFAGDPLCVSPSVSPTYISVTGSSACALSATIGDN